MKTTKITHKILEKFKPEEILYAEYATEGAMGACGTARIYAFAGGELKYYQIGDVLQNEKNAKIYGEVIAYLDKLGENKVLDAEYGGYGNYGFRRPGVVFARDDDKATFLYRDGGKAYKIPASCAGVYANLAPKFAQREMSVEVLEEYYDKKRFEMNGDEGYFFEQYLLQLKRTDSGQDWFDFTPLDYYSAVQYLRHLSGEDYILSAEDISRGAEALYKYRLQYVVDKLGWNKLNKIFVQLARAGKTDLFARIAKLLGEPVDGIYDSLEVAKTEKASFRVNSADNIEKLFNRPVLIEFPKAAHRKLLDEIYERPGNSLNPDGLTVGYYLANYILNEDKLSFADALPAVTHIVEVLPNDDFNHTHTDELFWLCGQLLDQAWRYLEEDEKVQKKYRQMMYQLYSPRVGSLWPIMHRDEFEFNRESAAKMFDDAVSFVMSLEDITEMNAEVKAFFDANAEHIGYRAGPLGRRAFMYTLKDLPAKEEFERILEVVEPDDYDSFLCYPDTVESAQLLLDELFRTDPGARITGYPRMAVFEALVLRPNTMGVGEFVLGYLDEHFEEFVAIVSTEVIAMKMEPIPVLADLFVAMSKGMTEENEFPAFKSIKGKLLRLGCDSERLDNAEKYARKHRRTILFQRSALQKIF